MSDLAEIVANLKSRRLEISRELAGMATDKAGGLPDYKGSGGVSHVAYRKSLYEELAEINKQLLLYGDGTAGGATVERIVDI